MPFTHFDSCAPPPALASLRPSQWYPFCYPRHCLHPLRPPPTPRRGSSFASRTPPSLFFFSVFLSFIRRCRSAVGDVDEVWACSCSRRCAAEQASLIAGLTANTIASLFFFFFTLSLIATAAPTPGSVSPPPSRVLVCRLSRSSRRFRFATTPLPRPSLRSAHRSPSPSFFVSCAHLSNGAAAAAAVGRSPPTPPSGRPFHRTALPSLDSCPFFCCCCPVLSAPLNCLVERRSPCASPPLLPPPPSF